MSQSADKSDFIKVGVIGHPVAHSLSPVIHNYWIRQHDLSGRYEALAVEEGALAEKLEAFIAAGYSGFNVTLPHKQAVLSLCDELDEAACAIGAVNTLIVEEGRIKGANTDAYGFTANLKEQAPTHDFTQSPALILGAGGASRAVLYALKKMNAPEIRITNRTASRMKALADEFSVTPVAWDDRSEAGRDVGLVVNTTSLGMVGQPALSFDLAEVPKGAAVCDIVYNPLYTPLLKEARRRGHKIIDGLGMLLHQAAPGFSAWFGVSPAVTPALRSICLVALEEKERLV